MKLLHCTDLHFKQSALDWILNVHLQYDAICLTGDFLDTRDNVTIPLSEQISQLSKWFTQFTQPIFICSGNHDWWQHSFDWLKGESVKADGQTFNLNGVRFGCIGYQKQNYPEFANCDVILHHEPPARTSPAKQSGIDYGDESLYWALKNQVIQPQFLLCGHVHQPLKKLARFKQTIISNPGGVHTSIGCSYAEITIR